MKKKKKKKKSFSSIEIENEANSSFNDVKVMWISRFDYQSDWVLPPHEHDNYYQIIFIISGTCSINIDNEEFNISRPCIIFAPPQVSHGIFNLGEVGLKTLDVKFQINSSKLKEKCRKIQNINYVYEYDFKCLFESIIEEGKEHELEYQSYCQLILGEILIKLLRQSNDIKEEVKISQKLFDTNHLSKTSLRLIAFIENNYNHDIKAEDFEKSLHLSYRYLSQLTKKEIGNSPTQMVLLYRLFLSTELLAYSDKEIKEISEDIGFLSVHQFSRAFKRIIGIPPGAYKKRKKNGICEDILIQNTFKNKILIENK